MVTPPEDELPTSPERARDRHDSMIQRLFGAGLLQSALAGVTDPAVRERVRHAVTVPDEIIDEIRSVLHAGFERAADAGDGEDDRAGAGPSALSAETPKPQDDPRARMDGVSSRTDRRRPTEVPRSTGPRARPR
jgi:hypothetical protein